MYQHDCRATGRNVQIIDATSYFEMYHNTTRLQATGKFRLLKPPDILQCVTIQQDAFCLDFLDGQSTILDTLRAFRGFLRYEQGVNCFFLKFIWRVEKKGSRVKKKGSRVKKKENSVKKKGSKK